jgi:hypothetical protein
MPTPRLAQLEARYVTLRQALAGLSYLSHGSVYRRPAGQAGTRFTWSTKVNAKTVSLALSEEQCPARTRVRHGADQNPAQIACGF